MRVSFDNVPRSVGWEWDMVRNAVLNQLYCETLALSDISDICDVINDESMRISSTRTSAQQLLDSTMCSVSGRLRSGTYIIYCTVYPYPEKM